MPESGVPPTRLGKPQQERSGVGGAEVCGKLLDPFGDSDVENEIASGSSSSSLDAMPGLQVNAVEWGLVSESFPLPDEQAAHLRELDTAGASEVRELMQQGLSFDEARLQLVRRRMSAFGIDETGMPTDSRCVTFGSEASESKSRQAKPTLFGNPTLVEEASVVERVITRLAQVPLGALSAISDDLDSPAAEKARSMRPLGIIQRLTSWHVARLLLATVCGFYILILVKAYNRTPTGTFHEGSDIHP